MAETQAAARTVVARIAVEVVYAAEHEQAIVQLQLNAGATLADAIMASGLREHYALDDLGGRIGVFGRLCAASEVLYDGDRVEIYRPLLADPKDSRRARVRAARRARGAANPKP